MSKLFTRTERDSSDASKNAQLLTRAGFIDKLMSGVYSYLPLGLMVLNNIEKIVREELSAIGSQEIMMPALQPKEIWETTGRWNMDVLYKFKGHGDSDLTLGATHEEVVTPLIRRFVKSYRNLPVIVDQIQTKFRNEARAKSGLLRGREFRMSDMYSFHATQEDHERFYYESVIPAYKRIFDRCGIGDKTYLTHAPGGEFSKFSHEFQTISSIGEDTIFITPDVDRAAVSKDLGESSGEQVSAIEVGNIFNLHSRFTDAFGATYVDSEGKQNPIHMGCYGIGTTRLMGTIVEILGDEKGLVWPAEIAPFQIHLVSMAKSEEEIAFADAIYDQLVNSGISVLYDDRDIRAGEKMAECDLLGMPTRIVVSKKTIAENSVEIKSRTSDETRIISVTEMISELFG